MLNTLANHGFLPRDGTNITQENAVHALSVGLGFDPTTAVSFWGHGMTINTDPNATFFTLYVFCSKQASRFADCSLFFVVANSTSPTNSSTMPLFLDKMLTLATTMRSTRLYSTRPKHYGQVKL